MLVGLAAPATAQSAKPAAVIDAGKDSDPVSKRMSARRSRPGAASSWAVSSRAVWATSQYELIFWIVTGERVIEITQRGGRVEAGQFG